jgi:hypothetical protein
MDNPKLKPVKLTSVPSGGNNGGDEQPRPMVANDDHIYFSTDAGAHHGKVVAIGQHGCTCDDADGKRHEVLWDSVLGHKKRADKRLVIVDKGEDGFIAKNEDGKLVFVRGEVGDAEHPENTAPPAEESKLHKAQVISELAKAGFEPMLDYVRAEFGDHFVYKPPVETDLRKSLDGMLATQSAQAQGLAAAVSMLADKVSASEKLTKALLLELSESRKAKQASLPLE